MRATLLHWGAADGQKGYSSAAMEAPYDYFSEHLGQRFAGTHLLLDLWGCAAHMLNRPLAIEATLRQAAADAQATVLHVNLHHFHTSGGVTGVLLLAESHISIHTWPEHGFAAIDIFMCGGCNPAMAVPRIQTDFSAIRVETSTHRRGLLRHGKTLRDEVQSFDPGQTRPVCDA